MCNAHLLRDLTFIAEAYPPQQLWTNALCRLLIEMKDAVEAARQAAQTKLDAALQNVFLERYDGILSDAERAIARASPPKINSLTPQQLVRRLTRNKREILCFLFDFAVPFDNNGSERDLRMLKLQQKIAGCFRTMAGALTFCRIRSYLSSARKQGRSVPVALKGALLGKPTLLNRAVLIS